MNSLLKGSRWSLFLKNGLSVDELHDFAEMPLEASIFADSYLDVDDSIVEVYLETKVFVDLDGSHRKRSLKNDNFILDFDVEGEVLVEEIDDL